MFPGQRLEIVVWKLIQFKVYFHKTEAKGGLLKYFPLFGTNDQIRAQRDHHWIQKDFKS